MTETDAGMSTATASTLPPVPPRTASGAASVVRKRGRKPAQFWVSFTTLEEPYKARTAPCRHCDATVNYHKKWEQAKSHLLKCGPFLKLMQETDAVARPEWFTVEVEKRRRSAVKLLPIDVVVRETDSASDPSVATVTFKPSGGTSKTTARAKKRESLGGGVDGMSVGELLVLQAMQGGGSVDLEFVGQMLDGAQSVREILDKVYGRVRRCVMGELCGVSTLVVCYDDKAKRVEYRAATDDKTFFLERASAPGTTESSGDATTAAWIVEDIQRMVGALETHVHHCVLHGPSEVVRRAVELSKESSGLAATPIRYSPLQALVEMAEDILNCALMNEVQGHLSGFFTTALTCHDILSLLGLSSGTPSYIRQQIDTTRRVVEARRCMSLADAVWAIMDAGRLFDGSALRPLTDLARLDATANSRVLSMIESDDFALKVRRLRAVVEPLCISLALAEKQSVYPSDLFVSFTSLQRSYRVSGCLTETEQQALIEKIEKYRNLIVQDGDELGHLLDPAYLGELLDVTEKATAEQNLFAKTNGNDVAEKQTLFGEYTQFQLAVVQQQMSNEGFVRQMLRERKKTMLQYWLTDGRRWPRLQGIALQIEQAPVDAGVLKNDTVKHILPPGSHDEAAEEFLRVNTPLFSMLDIVKTSPVSLAMKSRVDDTVPIENEVMVI